MMRKEILNLLEDDSLQEEQNVVQSTKRVNIGRLSGKIAIRDIETIRNMRVISK